MKGKTLRVLFAVSFALTGCSVDSIFDSPKAAITWVATAMVMLATMKVLGDYCDDDK